MGVLKSKAVLIRVNYHGASQEPLHGEVYLADISEDRTSKVQVKLDGSMRDYGEVDGYDVSYILPDGTTWSTTPVEIDGSRFAENHQVTLILRLDAGLYEAVMAYASKE